MSPFAPTFEGGGEVVVAAYNLFDVMYAMLIYYAGSYHSRESQRILGTRLTEREHDKKKKRNKKKNQSDNVPG